MRKYLIWLLVSEGLNPPQQHKAQGNGSDHVGQIIQQQLIHVVVCQEADQAVSEVGWVKTPKVNSSPAFVGYSLLPQTHSYGVVP